MNVRPLYGLKKFPKSVANMLPLPINLLHVCIIRAVCLAKINPMRRAINTMLDPHKTICIQQVRWDLCVV